MKKYWLIFAMCLVCAVSRANNLVLWDFNFPPVPVGQFGTGDANAATGTNGPNGGVGTLTVIGGATSTFASPPGGGGTATSDGDVSDNSGLRITAFPAVSAANKTAGIQFLTSTAGFENIMLAFDQENSATASKYWRVQYTTDGGATWIDYTSYVTPGSTAWVLGRVIDFSAVSGARDNPNFGVRIVSEFQSTATGSGAASYIGNSGGYGTGGTCWFDMVTVSGTPITSSGNTPPTITAIPDQTVPANQNVGTVSFTVNDAETPAAQLGVTATSGNETLIADSDVHLSGTGTNRTLTITPEPNQSGAAQITVLVTDGGNLAASSLFNVTVLSPTIVVSNATVRVNNSTNAGFQITGLSSFLGTVTVTADSPNTALLPDSNINITGSGATRTIALSPVADQLGVSVITITATDGSLTATNSFYLSVVPTNTIALWDFNSQLLDFNLTTGSILPAIGSGIATNCGTSTNSLNSSLAATNFDPEVLDNSKWRFGSFPTQGTSNKTSGAEFHVSTVGYQNIALSFDHYNSATASRFWRIQYSLDGTNYTDLAGYSNVLVTTFFNTNFTFGAIAGANNNSNFAVRIVSEFESTAIGTANANYDGVQTAGSYSGGGTLWLDDINFTGDPYVAGANTPPTITEIPDQTVNANAVTAVAFTVNDAQTAAGQLTVSAASDNPTLIANSDISVMGTTQDRTLSFHPEANQLGSANITVTVTDANGATNSTVFNVTVQPPGFSIPNQTLRVNSPATVQLDLSSFLGTPVLSVDSSNTAVLIDTNIVITGSGASRTLTFTPLADQVGASLVILNISDGTFNVTNAFYLHWISTNLITFWDFNSPNFDLNASTGTTSPAFGSGIARSAGVATNSINSNVAPLDFDAEQADNSKWRFGAFPAGATGDKTSGAEFHVSTAGYQNIHLSFDQYNSASASQYWLIQYSTNGSAYTDFTNYNNTVAVTWFTNGIDFSSIPGANNNPNFAVRIVSEFQSSATGSGSAAYVGVSAGYSTGGTLWLDDVAVTGDAVAVVVQPTLSITTGGALGSLKIAWPASATGATLQSTPTLNPPNWQNVTQMPAIQGDQNVVTIDTSVGTQYFRLVH